MSVGVLALQGDFAAHAEMLRGLGAEVTEVRTPAGLIGIDGLVIPGGESTTISKGMAREGLDEAVRSLYKGGTPVLGSCAGMIVCDREHLALGDYAVRRNAFGRQLHSFEADLLIQGIGEEPLRAVFIRAPWVEDPGAAEVLAEFDGHPVALREGRLLACAFHPELTDDSRFHALFLAMVSSAAETADERASK
jgi:5'-phosphate synthase pdxT subunit